MDWAYVIGGAIDLRSFYRYVDVMHNIRRLTHEFEAMLISLNLMRQFSQLPLL